MNKTETCWLWTAYAWKGYGRWAWRNKKSPAKWNHAHRWTFWDHYGYCPEGEMTVDHVCKNTLCVNPEHLRELPRAENARLNRPSQERLAKTHCPRGHEYTPENTRYNRGNTGRVCANCDNARNRKKARVSPDLVRAQSRVRQARYAAKLKAAQAAQAVSRGPATSDR